jgi:hypothetical protein
LALRFKQPWRDGTSHVVFTPHELIEKLIPLIPRPRSHVVRYHGILGLAARDRDKVVPSSGPVAFGGPAPVVEPREMDMSRLPRFNRLPWAALLKRVFLVDVLECPKCRGRMKLLTAVTAPGSVRRILKHLGLESEAPRLHPARPPPQMEIEGVRAEPEDFYADPPGPEW